MRLIPFTPDQNTLQILARVQLTGKQFRFEFKITHGFELCDFSNANLTSAQIFSRQDLLWQHTCFEAFVMDAKSKNYFEFNFSPLLTWNVYEFTDYRQPQPPQTSQQFQLLDLQWKNHELTAVVENNSPYKQFQVGLCAVIVLKNKEKMYYALKHGKDKPDFHLFDNFTIEL